MVAGIDVGARTVHVVVLDDEPRMHLLDTRDERAIAEVVGGAEVVAVDAPSGVSTLPHAQDGELSPKFRRARCGEVALGREHGIWVSWVPPAERPADPWMEAGFDVFEVLGARAVETYPHAAFRTLAGGARLPRKATAAGRDARIELLRAAGVEPLERSHHFLDAAVAALAAADVAAGSARRVTCGHDDSAIWLPAQR